MCGEVDSGNSTSHSPEEPIKPTEQGNTTLLQPFTRLFHNIRFSHKSIKVYGNFFCSHSSWVDRLM
jgi:hypothetical protein